MAMKLIILGSGTSVPHERRASAAHWLETAHGSLLLDVSPDAAHRMAEERLDWPNLDAIWISHFHLDHFGGLSTFLFGTKWAPQTQTRTKLLRIFGPPSLSTLFNTVNESNDFRLLEQPFPIEIIEVKAGDEFEILPDLRAQTFSTPHTKESLAIRVSNTNGVSLVYTSDTGFSDRLAEFARGANVLLIECSFWKNSPVPNHLALVDAMNLARLANPQTTILTHLYPEWDGVAVAKEANTLWEGKVIEAVDGLILEF